MLPAFDRNRVRGVMLHYLCADPKINLGTVGNERFLSLSKEENGTRGCVCVCVFFRENHNLSRPEVLRISGCICSVRVSDITD